MKLNKWLGYDKPKKDDFNYDNQKIDEACLALSNSVEKIETAQAALKAAQVSLEAAQSSNASAQALNTLSSSLTSHSGNTTVHVTAAEKTAWSSGAGFVTGYYTGDGNSTKKITLGYQPRFGLIFAVNDGVGRVNWTSEQYHGNTGFMSQNGCSLGVALNTDGFTVQHSAMGGADGFSVKLNASGVNYGYFLWK